MENPSQFFSEPQQEKITSQKISKSLQKKQFKALETQISTMSIKNMKRESLKTEVNYKEQLSKEKNKLAFKDQSKQGIKFYPRTYRPSLLRAFDHLNQIILVYLMYKQQKISIFLHHGVTFEELVKRMYKEIYIFQKQCYSISNAILKNLLYKITGFQSIDDDLMLDYELKYKRGTLTKQKVFAPFKQQDLRMPFKLYGLVCDLPYGGHKFLARNYSDGNWAIVRTTKKCLIDEQKVTQIKKYLKSSFHACSLLMKNSPLQFSQINWLETKNYLIAVSEFFPQNLEQNLIKNRETYKQDEIQQIFIHFGKWLAQVFNQLVSFNIKILKKLSIKNISLNPDSGLPIISVFDNLIDTIESIEKKRNNLHSSGNLQKIEDNFYFETYSTLLTELEFFLGKSNEGEKTFQELHKFLNQQTTENKFSFESVIKYFQQYEKKQKQENNNKEQKFNLLSIDLTSKFQSIVQSFKQTKSNFNLASHERSLISEIKEEIHQAYSIQSMRKNKRRIQSLKVLMMMSTSCRFSELKKQQIVNLSEFKKQEERKSHLKTEEKMYIHQIINEVNQNQNFIKTTKQNNLASIGFYLQKSDQKLKKKITDKIENKYKKFLDKRQNFEDDRISTGMKNSLKQQNFRINKEFFSPRSKQNEISFLHDQNRKFSSLNKIKSQQNGLGMNRIENQVSHYEQNFKNAKLNQSILEKQSTDQSFSGSILRSSFSQTTVRYNKTKVLNLLSPNFKEKKNQIQQLFSNKKGFTKQDRVQLKKQHYGIYLEQADKQYSKIKALKKCTILYPSLKQ